MIQIGEILGSVLGAGVSQAAAFAPGPGMFLQVFLGAVGKWLSDEGVLPSVELPSIFGHGKEDAKENPAGEAGQAQSGPGLAVAPNPAPLEAGQMIGPNGLENLRQQRTVHGTTGFFPLLGMPVQGQDAKKAERQDDHAGRHPTLPSPLIPLGPRSWISPVHTGESTFGARAKQEDRVQNPALTPVALHREPRRNPDLGEERALTPVALHREPRRNPDLGEERALTPVALDREGRTNSGHALKQVFLPLPLAEAKETVLAKETGLEEIQKPTGAALYDVGDKKPPLAFPGLSTLQAAKEPDPAPANVAFLQEVTFLPPSFDLMKGHASQDSGRLDASGFRDSLATTVVWMAQEGKSSAQMQVYPPDMGQVQIRIDVMGNDARVHFFTSHPAVTQAIQDRLPELSLALSNQGFGNPQFSFSPHGGGQHPQQQQNAPHFPLPEFFTEKESVLPVVGRGLVDFYA